MGGTGATGGEIVRPVGFGFKGSFTVSTTSTVSEGVSTVSSRLNVDSSSIVSIVLGSICEGVLRRLGAICGLKTV